MDEPDVNTPLKIRPLLRCEIQYGALICLTCHNGYPSKPILGHLTDYHHFPKKLCEQAIQSFEHEVLAKDWKDLPHPANRVLKIGLSG
jgi:hypothetical protein